MAEKAGAILTKIKLAIAANTTFDTEADIWKRERLDSDEPDRSKITIWVHPIETRIWSAADSFVGDFRIYRIQIVLEFQIDGRSNAPGDADTVTDYKGTYNDALCTAIKTTNVGQTYAITNCSAVGYISTNWNHGEQGKEYTESGARIYRISQLWDFYTYES